MGETVFDPRTDAVIVQTRRLSEEAISPKEQALLVLVAAERVIIRVPESTGNFFSLRNVLPIRGQQTQRLGGNTTCGFRCS